MNIDNTKIVSLRVPYTESLTFNVVGSNKDESIPRMIELNNGYYEAEISQLLKQIIHEDWICIDVGANIGAITLMMASLANKGEVHCFEPVPQNYKFLEQNIHSNNIKNTTLNNLGLFSEEKTLTFHYVEEFAGGAYYSPLGVSDIREIQVNVECLTLDKYLHDHSDIIPRVNLIKIDVEGAEEDVLVGAFDTIKKYSPDLIIEFNPAASLKFYGKDMRGVYDKIVCLGYEVNMIIRSGGALLPIKAYEELVQSVNEQGGIADIYCSSILSRCI